MKADPRFLRQPPEFWAYVRTISEEVGYTQRASKRHASRIKTPTLEDIRHGFSKLGLSMEALENEPNAVTVLGRNLLDYLKYRANILNEEVEPALMNKQQAESEFKRLRKELKPKCPLPMNKQKGDKKSYAFLTGIVNMLVEHYTAGSPCDHDPRQLTTVTHGGMPLRTLSRRVDGAFPSAVNPIAIWEIKEYYYTTTFGSRVADGVYETLLDGMELEELERAAQRKIFHVLFLDARYTWWECGRSYLCRIVDMLHMGYVDEVLFGREVIERLPVLAREWMALYAAQNN